MARNGPTPRLVVAAFLLCGVTPLLSQSSPSVRDSSRIRIVEHGDVGGVLAPLRIGATPILDLAGIRANPEEEIDPRGFLLARPLSDGRWVVGDQGHLKVFDSRGRYLRVIGRAGQGPGEFRQIREFCVTAGDTIVVIGLNDGRIGVFDSMGTHVRTTAIQGRVGARPCLNDGSILVRHEGAANPHSALSRQQAALLDRVAAVERIRWDGTPIQALGLLPVESLDLTFEDVANIVAGNGRIHVGNGSNPEFSVYDPAGRLIQIVRWRAARVPITSALRAAAIRRGFLAGPVARAHLPLYSSILVGPDGAVWIQDYTHPDALGRGYTIFDSDGNLRGRVEPPPLSPWRVDILWVGTDRVLLGWRDADGAPHLTVHPLLAR